MKRRRGAAQWGAMRLRRGSRNELSEEVDFGGAYLAASAARAKDMVASFDKDLRKFEDIQLYDFQAKN